MGGAWNVLESHAGGQLVPDVALVDLLVWLSTEWEQGAAAVAAVVDQAIGKLSTKSKTGGEFALLRRLYGCRGLDVGLVNDLGEQFIEYAEQRLQDGLDSEDYDDAVEALADVEDHMRSFGVSLDLFELRAHIEQLASEDVGDDESVSAVPKADDGAGVDDLFRTLT